MYQTAKDTVSKFQRDQNYAWSQDASIAAFRLLRAWLGLVVWRRNWCVCFHIKEDETIWVIVHWVRGLCVCETHTAFTSAAPEHDYITSDHVTALPVPDVSWAAFLFVWGNCYWYSTSPSGWMVRVVVCVGIDVMIHTPDIWRAALLLGLWHKEYSLTGINKQRSCVLRVERVRSNLFPQCVWCVPIHVCACRCVKNKGEAAFKGSPTSQCHSNSLHLAQRNHNRGSRGIPHWHMTDNSSLKGNSTLKLDFTHRWDLQHTPSISQQLATKTN